jgi:pimeloyl-ACP methyl ester carboxylesterase
MRVSAVVLAAFLTASTFACAQPSSAQHAFSNRLHERIAKRDHVQMTSIAGLNVAVFTPSAPGNAPLPVVLFSHGFHGGNLQSTRLLQQIADSGYMIFAPDHADAPWSQRQKVPFGKPQLWSDATYSDRRDDMKHLLDALKTAPRWNTQLDFSRVALIGHSLGGYTVLGLEGAWPSWRLDGLKAVVAWSPYAPFVIHGRLNPLSAPTMYQTGTRDNAIRLLLEGPRGAFALSNGPKEMVVLNRATHFAWTNLDRDKSMQDLILHYTLAWLDKYVRGGIATVDPAAALPGASVITK